MDDSFSYNPPTNAGEVEFSVWAAEFRKRRAEELVKDGVHADRIRQMLDMEVDAARRRSQPLKVGHSLAVRGAQ